jgi:hypothetical protein
VFEELGFTVDLSNPNFHKSKFIKKLYQLLDNYQNYPGAPFAQYDSKVYPLDLMQK